MRLDLSDHGGRVHEAARRWGVSRSEVLDFSANINPMGPPPGAALACRRAEIDCYPDPTEFIAALSDKIGLSAEDLVLGNGSSGLIFAAIRALRPSRALLLEPSFGEYRRALRAFGADVETLLLREEDDFIPNFGALAEAIKSGRYDVVILNNPHNPTGALYPKDEVLGLARMAVAARAHLIIDEAFIDYVPGASALPEAASLSSVVVLRSLTKFYAIPGLRIGYAVCPPALAERVRAQIEAWAVSSVALDAALAAISDHEYERMARELNQIAREQFSRMLGRLPGVKVFPSAANFLLVKFDRIRGSELERWLDRHRILIRRCDAFAGLGDEFVRLAVRSPEDNLRLARLVEDFMLESR